MKGLAITLIMVTIAFWSAENAFSQTANQQDPAMSGMSANLYRCPNHPEVTATWPAKCPKCGETLVRGQRQSRQNTSGRARAEEMRRRVMLNTSISVFDPEAILSAKRPLSLTQEQIEKLQAISMAAREGAKKILTEKQRKNLMTLDNLSNFPGTMAQMHRRILQGMPASNDMMLDTLLHQMRSRNWSRTRSDPPAQNSDPPSLDGPSQDQFMQSTLNSLSARNRGTINTYGQMVQNDPFQQSTLISLDAGNRGGTGAYNQTLLNDPFQQGTLDSLRDRYRDEYRDNLRDNYRDQLRDHYRDLFRDQYRDNFGDLGGFGQQGFGDEGFGNSGFGEGFGTSGLGEGFGTSGLGEGSGRSGLGEGFGSEGFGGSAGRR